MGNERYPLYDEFITTYFIYLEVIMIKRVLLSLTLSSTLIFSSLGATFAENLPVQAIQNYHFDEAEESEAYLLTLEDYLGMDVKKLNPQNTKTLQVIIDKINQFEFDEEMTNIGDYEALYETLRVSAKKMGLLVPYGSFSEFIEAQQSKLDKTDYKTLQTLDQKIESLSVELAKLLDNEIIEKINALQSEIDEATSEIDTLLLKNGIHPDEARIQFENNIVLALFDVKNTRIYLSDKSITKSKEISKETMALYQRIWQHVIKIVPENYRQRLSTFEINTDGTMNIMAHVVSETMDQSKWRLAIDIKDALNSDGEFSDEFNNTVVHELMHIISLNKSQLAEFGDSYAKTYTTEEGTLKQNSYLNQFYQKFWKPIEADFESLSAEEGAFYEKYASHFVSDYAATNPVEDLAEVFRVFVMEDAPKNTKDIKDQKVQFLYGYKSLVQLRNEIRHNLGL